MVCLNKEDHTKWLNEFDGRVSDLGKLEKGPGRYIDRADQACHEVIRALDGYAGYTAATGIPEGILPIFVPREKMASCNETVDGFRCHRSKCFPPGRSKIDGTTLPVFPDAAAIHGQSEKLVVLIERSELIWSWR